MKLPKQIIPRPRVKIHRQLLSFSPSRNYTQFYYVIHSEKRKEIWLLSKNQSVKFIVVLHTKEWQPIRNNQTITMLFFLLGKKKYAQRWFITQIHTYNIPRYEMSRVNKKKKRNETKKASDTYLQFEVRHDRLDLIVVYLMAYPSPIR